MLNKNIKLFILFCLIQNSLNFLQSDELSNKNHLINEKDKLGKDLKKELIPYKKIQNNLFLSEAINDQKELIKTISKKFKLSDSFYLEPLYLGPYIPMNVFPSPGDLSHSFVKKSAFSGGDANGIGNQIYSYRIDYGVSDDFFISGFIAEADDPLFFSVDSRKHKNFWRNYAFAFNKRIFNKKDNFTISFFSSFEFWNKVTYFKTFQNDIKYKAKKSFIGLLSLPITRKISNQLKLTIAPQYHFLPDQLEKDNVKGNFFGDSFSIGLGSQLRLSKDFYLLNSLSFPLGPGFNSFDSNLDFYKYPIYSYGFNWDPSPIIGISGKITNSFGETPATSILTIPSANLPLYYIGINLRPDNLDIPIKEDKEIYNSFLFGGLSVKNALIPKRGKVFKELNFDSRGNIFGSYKYSFSNIFQLEFINLGTFKGVSNKKEKTMSLKNTYLSDGNFHTRYGGTLNIFSKSKNDSFWLSNRTTLGRDQNSMQGYFFTELLSSNDVSNILFNLSPKYYWSGIKSLSGIGLSINYIINKNYSIIPEYNFNITDNKNSNYTLAIRKLITPTKSIDFYMSNAQGFQDIGQLLKGDGDRVGIKINFISL